MRRKTAHTVRYLRSRGVLEQEASHKAAAISLELANITKTAEFAIENINRINSEIEKFDEQKESLVEGAAAAKDDIKRSRLILMQSHRPFWHQRTTILSLTNSSGRALPKRKRCLKITEAFCKAGGSFKETG